MRNYNESGAPMTGTNNPVTVAPPTGAMATEPAVIVGSIAAIVSALLALFVAFGFDLTTDQQAAIMGIVAAVAPVVAAIVIRAKVFAPNTVQRVANNAAETGDATVPPPPAK